MQRRERTRRLIELGGLVEKSGLRDHLGDDDPDATLYGALLALKRQVDVGAVGNDAGAPSPAEMLARWRHSGRRALREMSAAGPDEDA
jgi:hypothetical protein